MSIEQGIEPIDGESEHIVKTEPIEPPAFFEASIFQVREYLSARPTAESVEYIRGLLNEEMTQEPDSPYYTDVLNITSYIKQHLDEFGENILTSWNNPKTNEQELRFVVFEEVFDHDHAFYHEMFGIELDETECRDIWARNKENIIKSIQTYGFDWPVFRPKNMPATEEVARAVMGILPRHEVTNEPARILPYGSIDQGGGLAGIINTPDETKTQLTMTYAIQELTENPVTAATINMDVMQLTGLPQPEVERRIRAREPLPINCKVQVGNETIRLVGTGESIKDKMILHGMFWKKYGKHLDATLWSRQLGSYCGGAVARVVYSGWNSENHELCMYSDEPGHDPRLRVRFFNNFY